MLNYSQEKPKVQLPVTPVAGIATKPSCGAAQLREETAALTVGEILQQYENSQAGWRSRAVNGVLVDEWVPWILELAPWKNFLTLTFKEEKTPDVALSLFRWLVRVTNERTFGKRYARTVGHSYYSYCYGMEYQKRDVVHFHVLTDKPIDYTLVHSAWGNRCGFAWIDGNLTKKEDVITYVCKYVLKGGEIDVYKAKKDFVPKVLPTWWNDGSVLLSRAEQQALFPAGQLVQPLTGSLITGTKLEMATR